MNRAETTRFSRRSLGRLLAAAPVAAQGTDQAKSGPAEQARARRSANSAQLRTVELPRETEPSFRFEP